MNEANSTHYLLGDIDRVDTQAEIQDLLNEIEADFLIKEVAHSIEDEKVAEVNTLILNAAFPPLTDEDVNAWDSFGYVEQTRRDLERVYTTAA